MNRPYLMTEADTSRTLAQETVLIIGASGQLGTELVPALAKRHGAQRLVLADLREPEQGPLGCTTLTLDVTNAAKLNAAIVEHRVGVIYHLAALLSATGEKNPALAWEVNMGGLLNVLNAAVEHQVKRVFWPSSIAVFGPNSPKENTPQHCTMDPQTMYGITKLAGERLCEYYHLTRGLDVRSIRYPGLISYAALPGGGTTDYAVEVFYAAKQERPYTSFLGPDAALPMLYMPDAVAGTLQLMAAPAEQLRIWSSYNLHGMRFTPAELFGHIAEQVPGFSFDYQPDFRQSIADNWPGSIDDSYARTDWGWQPAYDTPALVAHMLAHVDAAKLTLA